MAIEKYRILSLDGGGLTGLVTARMLENLCKDSDIENWLDKTDLLVGSSSGGVIALCIAFEKAPEVIADFLYHKSAELLKDSWLDNILDVGKIFGAQYSNWERTECYKNIFGQTKLGELSKKVAITAFDLDYTDADSGKRNWKPKIFHNFTNQNDTDVDELVTKVALYTSAAPTYFPTVDGYIDGGVFANNPAMIGYAQAISKRYPDNERAKDSDQIVLLSIGAGENLRYIEGSDLDWGYFQWIRHFIRLNMEGVSGIADYQVRQLLEDNYERLQVTFAPEDDFALDDVSKIGRINEIGINHPVNDTAKWIKDHWM